MSRCRLRTNNSLLPQNLEYELFEIRFMFYILCDKYDLSRSTDSLADFPEPAFISLAGNLPRRLKYIDSLKRRQVHNSAMLADILTPPTFDKNPVLPLLQAILNQESHATIFGLLHDAIAEHEQIMAREMTIRAFLADHDKDDQYFVTDSLQQILESIYIDVPDFLKTLTTQSRMIAASIWRRHSTGKDPSYTEHGGWKWWPQNGDQFDVLEWLDHFVRLLKIELANEDYPSINVLSSDTYQDPDSNLWLHVSVNDPPIKATVNPLQHIRVIGTLSSPDSDASIKTWSGLAWHARRVFKGRDECQFVLGFTLCGSTMRLWQFDRAGAMASESFDINKDGWQFMSSMIAFLKLDNNSIGRGHAITANDEYTEFEAKADGLGKSYPLHYCIYRPKRLFGDGSTCYKIKPTDDGSVEPSTVKEYWEERETHQAEMLQRATHRNVVHVARYYHHKPVYAGSQEENMFEHVRRGLNYTKGKEYSIPHKRYHLVDGEHAITSGSYSRIKPSRETTTFHRLLFMKDYGTPIYTASSLSAMLFGLRGCLIGYHSLYHDAGILHGNISMNKLLINEELDRRHPQFAFLVGLRLAFTREQQPRLIHNDNNRLYFAAIGDIHNTSHTFWHGLESFFWVLFWICLHHRKLDPTEGFFEMSELTDQGRDELTNNKCELVTFSSDDFLSIRFSAYYRPILPWLNQLREVVFPDGESRNDGDEEVVYDTMLKIFEDAANELRD